jgi:hypothetical protein
MLYMSSPLKVNGHFGGTYRLHLEERAGMLHGLYDPEDGGNMFL